MQFQFQRFRRHSFVDSRSYFEWLTLYESKFFNDFIFVFLDRRRHISCVCLVRQHRSKDRCIHFSSRFYRCLSRESRSRLNDLCSSNQLDLQLFHIKLSTKFEVQLYLEHFNIRFRVDLIFDQFDFLLYIIFAWCSIEMYKLALVNVEARIMHLASFLAFAIWFF